MADSQRRLQTELEKFKTIGKDFQKVLSAREKLGAQLTENTLVKEELDRVELDAKVFKLVGPVLVRQDPAEARSNVQKRIDYINGELKRYDANIKDCERKQSVQKDTLMKLQCQHQQQQVKAAVKV